MAYQHGVYTNHRPTSITPPVTVDSGIPVVIGAAAIHAASTPAGTAPVIAYNYGEAVEAVGYQPENDEGKFEFGLSEAVSAFFRIGAVAPVVFINVLTVEKHGQSIQGENGQFNDAGEYRLEQPYAVANTIEVSGGAVEDVDYTVEVDNAGYSIITRTPSSSMGVDAQFTVTYSRVDPGQVTAADIIGGINEAGASTGIEAVSGVFARLRVTPGQILAPGFSQDPGVAAVMMAKGASINGLFQALSLLDIPTDQVTRYSDAAAWKNDNSYTDDNAIVCWPKAALAGTQYHLSTLAAARIVQTDADNDGVPYESPSNKRIPINETVLDDGSEVILDNEVANALNAQGIVTAQNFIGGWVLWGNRTGAYPGTTDPQRSFIPVRRMFIWNSKVLIQTYWQKVDAPTNRRLIEGVVDSDNIRLNGLTATGALLGGTTSFPADINPQTDLIDGIVRFRQKITPPLPARALVWNIEFDVSNLETLTAPAGQ